jgi:hypothetical protein
MNHSIQAEYKSVKNKNIIIYFGKKSGSFITNIEKIIDLEFELICKRSF